MAKGNLIGYYKINSLKKVFGKTQEAADFFGVGYSVLLRSLGKRPELIAFLKKNEDVKRVHANTYYGFYVSRFEKYIKSKSKLVHGCDECLKKNGLPIAYNTKFQHFGLCGYCGTNRDVSIGTLNKWLRREGILLDKRSHRGLLALLPRPEIKKTVSERPYPDRPKEDKKPKRKKKKKRPVTVPVETGTEHREVSVIEPKPEIQASLNEKDETRSKKPITALAVIRTLSWLGLIVLAIIYLPDALGSLDRPEIKEDRFVIPKFERPGPEIRSARGILLSKSLSDDGAKLMRYRNTDNVEWTIYGGEQYWDSIDIGDSLDIEFMVGKGELKLKSLKKIER